MSDGPPDLDRASLVRRLLVALPVALPAVLVAAVVVFAVVVLRGDDASAPPPPSAAVDIVATGPHFESLDDLVAASDVIVEGRIVAVDVGRAITDPSDPTSGFTTALFQLDVTRRFRGPARSSLIVEQEAALLDGTPITVNGFAPNQVGDTGFWFLVRGGDDAFPYVALVNEQARLLVDEGGEIDPVVGENITVVELRARLQE